MFSQTFILYFETKVYLLLAHLALLITIVKRSNNSAAKTDKVIVKTEKTASPVKFKSKEVFRINALNISLFLFGALIKCTC